MKPNFWPWSFAVLAAVGLVLAVSRPVIRAEVTAVPSVVKVGGCIATVFELQDGRRAAVAKIRAIDGHWVQVEMQDRVTQDAYVWMNLDQLTFLRDAGCPPK